MKNISLSLLHTAWTGEESKQIDEAIAYVENYNGSNFILDSSLYIYNIFKLDYILINIVDTSSELVIKSLLFLINGKISRNIQYPLLGAPCEAVYGKELSYYPGEVQALFPDNKILREMEVMSYLGIPFFEDSDRSSGCMALLHKNIIERGGFVEALVNVFLPSLVAEIAKVNKSTKSRNSYIKMMEQNVAIDNNLKFYN